MPRATPSRNRPRPASARPSGPPPTPPTSAGPRWWIALLLVLGTFVVFGRAVTFDFLNYDDDVYVTENPGVYAGLSPAGLAWAARAEVGANWHPLTVIAHQIDCQLFGLRPRGHHLSSLAWHAANVGLVYWIVARLTAAPGRALFLAALWGWHPLRIESVAWIAERKDVLSGFWALVTLGAYLRWTERPSRVRYALVVTSLALGLLAKPMLVTWPAVLVLVDLWPLGRWEQTDSRGLRALARNLREKWLLFGLAVAVAGVTFAVQRQFGSVQTIDEIGLSHRLANAAYSLVLYAGRLFWPGNLAIYYPHPLLEWHDPRVLASLALLAVVSGLVWRGRRRGYPLVGWLWFVGMLVPVIGLVQVGGAGHADRYTYLPHLGLAWAVVWGSADVLAGVGVPLWARRGVAGLALVVAVLDTQRELGYWRSGESVFRRATQVTAGNSLAWNNLGWALESTGRHAEALDAFQTAERLRPQGFQASAGVATALQSLGRLDEALAAYQRALPGAGDNPDFLNNLAWLLTTHPDPEKRDPRQAREWAERALELSSEPSGNFLDTLAETFAAEGRWAEAAATERRAIEAVGARSPLAEGFRARLERFEAEARGAK